jgi:hypothetical protein
MQPIDFATVVLPLGLSIVLLVVTILIMEARKEKYQDKKTRHAIEKLTKEKHEKLETFKNQQAELNKMYESKSIDEDTYERLTKLMCLNMQQYDETINSLMRESMANKPKIKPKHKLVVPQIGFS